LARGSDREDLPRRAGGAHGRRLAPRAARQSRTCAELPPAVQQRPRSERGRGRRQSPGAFGQAQGRRAHRGAGLEAGSMRLSTVVPHRVRGFRVVDLAALIVFLVLALTVYAFKTSAGAERRDIADVETQIRDETRDVRLLRAEVAHLESPDRLERLAT